MLRREGWPVNGKRVQRLMAELGLKGKAPARRRRTTDSRHDFPRYPNLVEGLKVTRTDQVWAAVAQKAISHGLAVANGLRPKASGVRSSRSAPSAP
jgi:transposase InsO family protein